VVKKYAIERNWSFFEVLKVRNFTIECLTSGHISTMRTLLNVFGTAFDEIDTYCDKQPDDKYLANLLDREDFIAVVAKKEGTVVGGLAAYVLQKFEQRRSEMYIYDLAVAEQCRREGIATALIVELKRIASIRGIEVIFVQADRGDDPAIELYTKLGTREDVFHFDISTD